MSIGIDQPYVEIFRRIALWFFETGEYKQERRGADGGSMSISLRGPIGRPAGPVVDGDQRWNVRPRYVEIIWSCQTIDERSESSAMAHPNPFPLPDHLGPDLQAVLSLWQELKRAENEMPFSDDLDLSALSSLSAKPFVLSVFTAPERFRFEYLDKVLQGTASAGRFIDEVPPDTSRRYLRAQSSATVEAAAPTFFCFNEKPGHNVSRLLVPLWGNGEINMLLGAIADAPR